jgi:hypothetical protein
MPNAMPNALPPSPENTPEFKNFVGHQKFVRHVLKHGHVPLWVHPHLANQLMAAHGASGAVVPQPANLDVNDLTK